MYITITALAVVLAMLSHATGLAAMSAITTLLIVVAAVDRTPVTQRAPRTDHERDFDIASGSDLHGTFRGLYLRGALKHVEELRRCVLAPRGTFRTAPHHALSIVRCDGYSTAAIRRRPPERMDE
ncbi:hypothetical protein ACTU6U_02460 [Microbacterium sp. A196]